jgi:hypothetical protein
METILGHDDFYGRNNTNVGGVSPKSVEEKIEGGIVRKVPPADS